MLSTRNILIAFILGFCASLLAILVLPEHYSFYMFFPARPETVIDRARLSVANILLAAGSAMSLLSSIVFAARSVGRKHYLGLLSPLVVLLNPFQQPVFFENLDTYVNYRMRDKAVAMHIVGKRPEEVKAIFGNPIRAWTESPKVFNRDGKVTWQGQTYTGWEYQPLPFYFCGSRFQLSFVDGRVDGYEANDD